MLDELTIVEHFPVDLPITARAWWTSLTMCVNRVVHGGGGRGMGLGMRETRDLVRRAGGALDVALAVVCERVLRAGLLG
jgi:hypothetical protein